MPEQCCGDQDWKREFLKIVEERSKVWKSDKSLDELFKETVKIQLGESHLDLIQKVEEMDSMTKEENIEKVTVASEQEKPKRVWIWIVISLTALIIIMFWNKIKKFFKRK